jgi:hypothetical protein
MTFLRTVTRNGKQYSYFQHSVRAGKKVRSLHLGKVPPKQVGLAYIARQTEKYPGDPFATKAAELEAVREKVGKELGVDLAKSGVSESSSEQTSDKAHSEKGSDDKGDV